MIIIPTIDLMDGGCVQVQQGDFNRVTRYDRSPKDALKAFEDAGASEVHIVDLDGARDRAPRQHDVVLELVAATSLKVQAAGGFTSMDDVSRALDAGTERVVIGSLALQSPETLDAMISRYGGDRLALSLDVRVRGGIPIVTTHGWQKDSGKTVDDVLASINGVTRNVLVTDIERDGMLGGPNAALIRALSARLDPISIQYAGGIRELDDLDALKIAGTERALIGKALWDGRFTLEEALARASA